MDGKGNCYDPFTIETIKRMRFDKAFLTSASISAEFGLSIQRSNHVEFVNAVINSSKCSVGLYPTEKIGFESIISICAASKLDILINDWNTAEDELKKFQEQEIEIIVVEKK